MPVQVCAMKLVFSLASAASVMLEALCLLV